MVVRRMSLCAAAAAACVVSLLSVNALFAQSGAAPDRAAGRMVDSLFEADAPASLVPSNSSQLPPRRGIKRPSLQAKLVRNANAKDGAPAYALVDRYGGILRYVEPAEKVNLTPYVGRVVGVRHDTGDTLLASQLIFPTGNRVATRSRTASGGVAQVAFQEPIPAGKPAEETLLEPTPADEPGPVSEGETYTFEEGTFEEGQEVYMGEGGPIYQEEGLDFGGCPDCESGTCSLHMGHGYRHGGAVAPRSRAYAHGEYLLWWFDGMDTPPLVTESSDLTERAAIISNPGVVPADHQATSVIYGGEPILEDARSGFRIKLGVWLDDCNKQAIEGDYLFLGDEDESFTAGGFNNNRVISRPYFELLPTDAIGNLIPPRNAAEAVSNDLIDGDVTVSTRSEFQGAGIAFRHNLCRSGCSDICCGDVIGCGAGVDCGCGVIDCGSGCGVRDRRYVDFLAGIRWYQLREELQINEALMVNTAGSTNIPPDVLAQEGAQIFVLDRFNTSNEFVGGEIGFDWGIERNRWCVDLLSKLAIGNNRQKVTIFGETSAIDSAGAPRGPELGGLLAQVSNIGNYERDRFSVVPELNLNVGYKLTQSLKLRVGYTLLYWTDVVRPGDQISLDVNNTLIPSFGLPATPTIPPFRPQFTFHETNVLIQGLNTGLEYNW